MMCNEKNIYESEATAKRVKNAAMKARKKRLRVYKCDYCHGWHLTSAKKFDPLLKNKKTTYEDQGDE